MSDYIKIDDLRSAICGTAPADLKAKLLGKINPFPSYTVEEIIAEGTKSLPADTCTQDEAEQENKKAPEPEPCSKNLTDSTVSEILKIYDTITHVYNGTEAIKIATDIDFAKEVICRDFVKAYENKFGSVPSEYVYDRVIWLSKKIHAEEYLSYKEGKLDTVVVKISVPKTTGTCGCPACNLPDKK